jgi:hypothetical protein
VVARHLTAVSSWTILAGVLISTLFPSPCDLSQMNSDQIHNETLGMASAFEFARGKWQYFSASPLHWYVFCIKSRSGNKWSQSKNVDCHLHLEPVDAAIDRRNADSGRPRQQMFIESVARIAMLPPAIMNGESNDFFDCHDIQCPADDEAIQQG